jgi:DNA-binding Xre family transcriptional regulator
MVKCKTADCDTEVTKKGFYLCYPCWKKENGKSASKKNVSSGNSNGINATKLGKEFGISGQKMNLLLNELGWTYKPRHGKGWMPSKQGKRQGAESLQVKQSGVPYVVWPEKVLNSRVLRRAIADFKGEATPKTSTPDSSSESTDYDDFRKKYPADYRCMDGHYVRSRAEAMIDNWLYTNGIAHAYERKLPIEADVYSDFYIRSGNVYIEFWGMESDAKYSARKKVKQKAYSENELNLIELNDNDLNHLDDILPRKLLQFDIRVH